jgi:hypothetical protein
MNLEDLNKSQLLLLTVLVNFVTSIAVGVLTVSLLDQAPPTITQTVNRIVDHTIETIASSTPIDRIITVNQPSTVVIHDEDLLAAALQANVARAVTIYPRGLGTTTPIAVGTFLPKARAIATATNGALPKEILVEFADGSVSPASYSKGGSTITIYGFGDNAALPKVPVPNLLIKSSLKPGQSVLALGAGGGAMTGIITKVDELIHTSLTGVPVGSAAVSSSGNIIGISINGVGDFAGADRISTLLNATSTAVK